MDNQSIYSFEYDPSKHQAGIHNELINQSESTISCNSLIINQSELSD